MPSVTVKVVAKLAVQRNTVDVPRCTPGESTVKLVAALSADLAYQYIRQNDRRGRTREPLIGAATTGMNNGLYDFHAHLFGVSLSYAF